MFDFLKSRKSQTRIYLDHAAGTPLRPEAREVFIEHLAFFGNPGTLHQEGTLAKKVLSDSREGFAKAIFCRSKEVVFTGSATESNNLAVFGSIFAWREKNVGKTPHIITTKIEHPSILEVCKHLESKKLAEVTCLEVSAEGIIDIKKFREALRPETVLISIIFASNEIGVIEPIREVAKEIRHFKKHLLENHASMYPLLHTDAAQAPLYEEISLRNLHVDLMTLSSEKIYGPHGVAALFVRSGTPLEKIMFGGSQEFDLRPGTENIAAIAGFTKALELAVAERENESVRIKKMRDYCLKELQNNFPGKFVVNGSLENRLPNNLNLSFKDFDSEVLVIELDARGISVSEKSACNTDAVSESYVIEALRPGNFNEGSLRLTLGRGNSKKEIDRLIVALQEIFEKYSKINAKTTRQMI